MAPTTTVSAVACASACESAVTSSPPPAVIWLLPDTEASVLPPMSTLGSATDKAMPPAPAPSVSALAVWSELAATRTWPLADRLAELA